MEKYIKPEVEVAEFTTVDVVATSVPEPITRTPWYDPSQGGSSGENDDTLG